ncbi:MAG: hypothetical protein H6Q85_1524, partial [candidate division NC10 bacterium]|nr:hypothetical protein [candidate division NC10 bacterium]
MHSQRTQRGLSHVKAVALLLAVGLVLLCGSRPSQAASLAQREVLPS